METPETKALIQICNQRFDNFWEAVESVLGALSDVVPGVLVLGHIDSERSVYRVLDGQGSGITGLHKGATLPLASHRALASGENAGSASDLDGQHLASLGAQVWVGVPLEMSDGRILGTLAALNPEAEPYQPEHVAMLGIAARLLSHEWENAAAAEPNTPAAQKPEPHQEPMSGPIATYSQHTELAAALVKLQEDARHATALAEAAEHREQALQREVDSTRAQIASLQHRLAEVAAAAESAWNATQRLVALSTPDPQERPPGSRP